MEKSLTDKLKKQFQGKRVLVVGLGLQGGGIGLAQFFSELGAKVKVTDLKVEEELQFSVSKLENLPIEYSLGGHKQEDFLQTDYIFKGPSVPWNSQFIKLALAQGIPVEMEASFFAATTTAKLIGITGTRGKSTTTAMIYDVLKKSGRNVYLGGNISGTSTIHLLEKTKEDDWVVLELSSWALSGFHRRKLSPTISVFTNLHTDHLNYYDSIKDYLYDKEAIYLYQKKGDFLIANKRLENIIRKGHIKSDVSYFQQKDFPVKLNFLRGDHNYENAAAALAVAKKLNIDAEETIEIIQQFKGLIYRQEEVGKKENVIFINDSTSTTPVATVEAIETFSDAPMVLILGGDDKKLPFGDLLRSLADVKKIILLKGSFTEKILPKLGKLYPAQITKVFSTLRETVEEAYREAKESKEKTYVVFSPASTSFSLFKNEFHRGEEFNNIVRKIIEQ